LEGYRLPRCSVERKVIVSKAEVAEIAAVSLFAQSKTANLGIVTKRGPNEFDLVGLSADIIHLCYCN